MAFIVGLTGGIGSGKSTVANIFAKFGAYIIDADAIAHELTATGSPALKEIAKHFGKNGTIQLRKSRKRISGP